jgi:hypothetical protein
MKIFECEFRYNTYGNSKHQYKTLRCQATDKIQARQIFMGMTLNPEYFALDQTGISFNSKQIKEIDEIN